MDNYKKDKSYIKQRLEYVNSVDYISELEEQIENLQQENEILLKKSYKDDVRITKAIEYIKSNEFKASDGEICYFCNMKVIKDILKILNGGDE